MHPPSRPHRRAPCLLHSLTTDGGTEPGIYLLTWDFEWQKKKLTCSQECERVISLALGRKGRTRGDETDSAQRWICPAYAPRRGALLRLGDWHDWGQKKAPKRSAHAHTRIADELGWPFVVAQGERFCSSLDRGNIRAAAMGDSVGGMPLFGSCNQSKLGTESSSWRAVWLLTIPKVHLAATDVPGCALLLHYSTETEIHALIFARGCSGPAFTEVHKIERRFKTFSEVGKSIFICLRSEQQGEQAKEQDCFTGSVCRTKTTLCIDFLVSVLANFLTTLRLHMDATCSCYFLFNLRMKHNVQL